MYIYKYIYTVSINTFMNLFIGFTIIHYVSAFQSFSPGDI